MNLFSKYYSRFEFEKCVVAQLEELGYENVTREETLYKMQHSGTFLLEDELVRFLKTQTYRHENEEFYFSRDAIRKAVKRLEIPLFNGLDIAGKQVYHILSSGVSVEEFITYDKKGKQVRKSYDLQYIDFENPENNIWQLIEGSKFIGYVDASVIPDIVILLNGIPIAFIEVSLSDREHEKISKKQLGNLDNCSISPLMSYIQLAVSINKDQIQCGTYSESYGYRNWTTYKSDTVGSKSGGSYETDRAVLKKDMASVFDHGVLLDLIQNYIIFEKNKKYLAIKEQYRSVKKMLEEMTAAEKNIDRESVIWNTTAEKQPFSMVMLIKNILKQPMQIDEKILLITDRPAMEQLVIENFPFYAGNLIKIKTGKALQAAMRDDEKKILIVPVNKVEIAVRNNYLKQQFNKVYVFADHAHEAVYKSIFHYLQKAFPKICIFAFSEYPLTEKKKDTILDRGNYFIDGRSMKKKYQRFGAVPIVYNRVNLAMKNGIREEQIAQSVAEHFKAYCFPQGLKAIVLPSSDEEAIKLYEKLKEVPEIVPRIILEGVTRTNISKNTLSNSIDRKNEYYYSVVEPLFGKSIEKYVQFAYEDYMNVQGKTNILIVRNAVPEYLDLPITGVLYTNRKMSGYELLTMLSNVSCPWKEKYYGVVMDYAGIFHKGEKGLEMYRDTLSGLNQFTPDELGFSLWGSQDVIIQIKTAYKKLAALFDYDFERNSVELQIRQMKDNRKRMRFYRYLKRYDELLNLIICSKELSTVIGIDKIAVYVKEARYYRDFKNRVSLIYNDEMGIFQYEKGLQGLWNTFDEDEQAHKIGIQEYLNSDWVKAETIKNRLIPKILEIRVRDPIRYKLCLDQLNQILDRYEKNEDDKKYLMDIKTLENDFTNRAEEHEYPISVSRDIESKILYSAVITLLQEKTSLKITIEAEELIAKYAVLIKKIMKEYINEDWKSDARIKKIINSKLDDCIFDMFDELNYTINRENVGLVDLIIDLVLKQY